MKLNDSLKLKVDKEKLYIFDSNYLGDILYEFTDTGFYILNFIKNNPNCNSEDIANWLKNKYKDVDYSIIFIDVNKFIEDLYNENILIRI